MDVSRLLAFGFVLLSLSASAFAAQPRSGFEAISADLHAAIGETGARGDALLIGAGNAIFYVETAGDANLNSSVTLTAKSDLSQLALVLALAGSGFTTLDDPVKNHLTLDKKDARAKLTIRDLLKARASGENADKAMKDLILIAESASARKWDALYKEWIAKPLGMEKTAFSKLANAAKAPPGVIETNARDYSRLLAALSAGPQEDAGLLSKDMTDLVFRSAVIGAASCLNQDETAACTLIEQDSVGLYAWVDRERGLYGVLTAPGAEVSIAKAGRLIRAETEAIFDREQAGAGLTSAVKH